MRTKMISIKGSPIKIRTNMRALRAYRHWDEGLSLPLTALVGVLPPVQRSVFPEVFEVGMSGAHVFRCFPGWPIRLLPRS